MTMGFNPEFADVNEQGYLTLAVSVTAVAVEAKVGATAQSGREWVSITNETNKKVAYGPAGVTFANGDKLGKNQTVVLPFGANIPIFVICNTGDSSTVIVQEGA